MSRIILKNFYSYSNVLLSCSHQSRSKRGNARTASTSAAPNRSPAAALIPPAHALTQIIHPVDLRNQQHKHPSLCDNLLWHVYRESPPQLVARSCVESGAHVLAMRLCAPVVAYLGRRLGQRARRRQQSAGRLRKVASKRAATATF